MTDRPILFSADEVLDLRDNRKTQFRSTRGLAKINAEPDAWDCVTEIDGQFVFRKSTDSQPHAGYTRIRCPFGVEGDRLWTREAFAKNANQLSDDRMDASLVYRADGGTRALDNGAELPWKPSIHMPRWASRDTLEVISARPERLHAITEADAIAEGFGPRSAIALFRGTWSVINGLDSWAKNPWIWRVAFKRLEAR